MGFLNYGIQVDVGLEIVKHIVLAEGEELLRSSDRKKMDTKNEPRYS